MSRHGYTSFLVYVWLNRTRRSKITQIGANLRIVLKTYATSVVENERFAVVNAGKVVSKSSIKK